MFHGPDGALCLVLGGWLCVYGEFLRPGLVVPGITGVAAVASGGYLLWQTGPASLALELLGGAAALFLVDAFRETHGFAATAGSVAMVLGFWQSGTSPALAIPCCLAFGALTAVLNWAARRARHNKRVDLLAGQ